MRIVGLVINFIYSLITMFTIYLLYSYAIFPSLVRIVIMIFLILSILILWLKLVYSKSLGKDIFRIIIIVIIGSGLNYINYITYTTLNKWDKIYKVGTNIYSENDVNTEKIPFTIYISGSDNKDSITKNSRSDVNILMTVNPKTKKILLTNTPRDAYVAINGDENKMDKLTHAGVYGVDASIKALEKLYGVKIDYFVKFNFSSFVDIINALEGIEIYSEKDFTAYGGASFTKGINQVDGDKALQFARERNSFARGDLVRGEHQQEIIKSLIKKATSINGIKNFDRLIKAINKDMVVANISSKKIIGVLNATIKDIFNDWEVKTQGVSGVGRLDLPSYAAPNQSLFIMELDKKIVNEAKEKIIKLIEER